MVKYCPYCKAKVVFPDTAYNPSPDLSDDKQQKLQHVREKPVRCKNPFCGKFLVKSECDDQP